MKNTRTDTLLLILTALFVGSLAVVAGAISFAHMRELATHHDQLGWKSLAFPVSVDGLESVASLYLVAQRRAGRPTGWVPWVALIVGTAASLAANVAVGGADVVGRALAGWPAVSMLVSVKLLSAMFDHDGGGRRTAVGDDQRPSRTIPDGRGPVRPSERDNSAPSATVPADRSNGDAPVRRASRLGGQRPGVPADSVEPQDRGAVIHLIPAARAACTALADDGRSLSRDNLADALRDAGHGISNARASLLLKIIKAEPQLGSSST